MPTFLETAHDHLCVQRVSAQTARHNTWLLGWLKPLHLLPIGEVSTPQVLAALRAIESSGSYSTAHRACSFAGAVLRYALAAGTRTLPDPTPGLKSILVPSQGRNRAAITDPARFGALLAAIDTLEPSPVRDALTLAPHLFVRPGELRGMRWAELDFDKGEWSIPAERMKMRRPFVKYLSEPVMDKLRLIGIGQPLGGEFVFPGRTSGSISENIMGLALQRLFYSPEEHTPHGFRASASTMLHEAGYAHDIIEAALAHRSRDAVSNAYNRATYAQAQRDLHCAWSGMIAAMKGGAS